GHLALEITRHDVSGLQIQQGGERDVAIPEARGELNFRVGELLAQGDHPALVLFRTITGNARIENLTHRLDPRVGHGHLHVTAAAVHFDVKARHDHDFRRRDDVGEMRVDFGLDELELDRRDVRPRLVQIGKHVAQHHVDDALLGRREFAAFDLRVAPGAAEEVVHEGEHELRLENHERSAAQRIHLDQIEARGHVQRVDVLAEFLDLNRLDGDLRRAAQEVVETDAEHAGETLIDELERRHSAAHDPHLFVEVVRANFAGVGLRGCVYSTVVDAMDECVDFGLVEYLVVAHVRCLRFLHYETGEVDLFDVVRLAAGVLHDVTYCGKRVGAELFLARTLGNDFVLLVGEEHQQVVAHYGIVGLQDLYGRRVARHDLHSDLQEADELVALEVDDERGIQGYVQGRCQGLLGFLRGLLAVSIVMAEGQPGTHTTPCDRQERDDSNDQPLLALRCCFGFGRRIEHRYIRHALCHSVTAASACRFRRKRCNARATPVRTCASGYKARVLRSLEQCEMHLMRQLF